MKLYTEGTPVSFDFQGEKYYGITLPPLLGETRLYYMDNNTGQLYYMPEEWRDHVKIRRNRAAFSHVKVHAKIISITDSIYHLGGKQRKQEFKGTVLPVMEAEATADDSFDIITLRTSRPDGAYIKMLSTDLRFIYPVILPQASVCEKLSKGDDVICIKTDNARTFNKGEKFVIQRVVMRSTHDSDFDVVIAEKDNKSVTGYAKHFKKRKKDD